MIRAGRTSEILWSNGTWLILDIGFSNKSKSCGLLLDDGEPENVLFHEAVEIVRKTARQHKSLNLVIEAPLSVSFDTHGNPKVRSIEKQDNKMRGWYCGPGSAVMVAAMYLLKQVTDSSRDNEIRLFEGFISYKNKRNKTSHAKDAELLMEVIKHPKLFMECILEPELLKLDYSDEIVSAFKVTGMNIGVPPVIKRDSVPTRK